MQFLIRFFTCLYAEESVLSLDLLVNGLKAASVITYITPALFNLKLSLSFV